MFALVLCLSKKNCVSLKNIIKKLKKKQQNQKHIKKDLQKKSHKTSKTKKIRILIRFYFLLFVVSVEKKIPSRTLLKNIPKWSQLFIKEYNIGSNSVASNRYI